MNDVWGNVRRGAKITGQLDRTAFGMTYNATLESGGLLIGNQVAIAVDLQFVLKKTALTSP